MLKRRSFLALISAASLSPARDAFAWAHGRGIARLGSKFVYSHYLHAYILGDYAFALPSNTPPSDPNTLINWPPTELFERSWWPDSLNAIAQSGVSSETVDLGLAHTAGLDAFAVLVSPTNIKPPSQFLQGLNNLATAAASTPVKLFPDLWFSINPNAPDSPGNPRSAASWAAFGQNVKTWMDASPNACYKNNGKLVIAVSSALYSNNISASELLPFFNPWGGADAFQIIESSGPFTILSDFIASGWSSVSQGIGRWVGDQGWQARSNTSVGPTNYTELVAEAAVSSSPIVWPVCPAYFAFRDGVQAMQESYGASTLVDNWLAGISTNAAAVNIETWNDFSEDSAITQTNTRGTTRIHLNRYFADWFRNGSQPVIAKDRLFLFYHRQLLACTFTQATVEATVPPPYAFQNPMADYLSVVSMLTSPGTLTLTCGALNMSLSAPAGLYQWLVYVSTPPIIFDGTAMSDFNDNTWAGYNVVQTLDPSLLLANTSGVVQVQFAVGAGTSGTLDSAWIGELGGSNLYSFDGNQVQLTFASSGSRALSGREIFTSDFVNFAYDSTKTLVVAAHFTGSLINLQTAGNFDGGTQYSELGVDVSSQTDKSGFTRSGAGRKLYYVREILMQGQNPIEPASNSGRNVNLVNSIPTGTPAITMNRGAGTLATATGPIAIVSTAPYQDLTMVGAESADTNPEIPY